LGRFGRGFMENTPFQNDFSPAHRRSPALVHALYWEPRLSSFIPKTTEMRLTGVLPGTSE
jgi:hypothetical protein